MLFNNDIDSYLIDFFIISQLNIYSILSKSTNKFFKQSKYHPGFKICNSLENICNLTNANLFYKALIEFNFTKENLELILIEKYKKSELTHIKLLIKKGANCRLDDIYNAICF